MKTNPWYTMSKADDRQGLICDEVTGANIAVTYDPKHAHLIAAAPEMYTLLDRASHLLSLPFNHELHNGSTFEALRNKINALLAEIDRGES